MLPYARAFEKYIGRPLRKWEAAVIAPVERMRQRGLQRRIIIRDTPSRDSRHILIEYIRYCTATSGHNACIIAPTIRAARTLSGFTASDRGIINLGTYRRPDRCRGIDITFALLLDADDASYRHLMATYSTICGSVDTIHSSLPFIIVHTVNIEPVWALIPFLKTYNPTVPPLPKPIPPRRSTSSAHHSSLVTHTSSLLPPRSSTCSAHHSSLVTHTSSIPSRSRSVAGEASSLGSRLSALGCHHSYLSISR